jgi:phosphoribosylaminoimidazole-succinocarboxamide synthase
MLYLTPDPNVVIGRRLTIMPVEIVVRDYMTGINGDIHLADV